MTNDARCVLLGIFDEHARPVRTAWCGKKEASLSWVFEDASHALLTHRKGPGSIPVCPKCLRAMRAVIDQELGEP